jgi:hypothetical protein
MSERLTDDEVTVLLIAAHGESMMAIGRWEPAVESLVRKGFMRQMDRFNNFITPAGKAAIEAADKEDEAAVEQALRATVRKAHLIAPLQNKMQGEVEAAAQALVQAAHAAHAATGDLMGVAIDKIAAIAVRRAKEMTDGT